MLYLKREYMNWADFLHADCDAMDVKPIQIKHLSGTVVN